MVVKPLLVLGVGNPMFGDDGFGIEFVHAARPVLESDLVEVVDGGTAGIYLLPYFEERTHVWIVDAVHFRGAPGELLVADASRIRQHLSVKMSEHQTTLNEVLALLDLMGSRPASVKLLGVQPKHMIFAGGLSGEVRQRIPEVITILQREVEEASRAVDERAVLVG